mmetsp:Transcript_14753/g.33389  ORF Transcript_14753/g.33389 Transcript_14753/m.33389 type:complete len:252 (+) Transcript_14753:2-757(+)
MERSGYGLWTANLNAVIKACARAQELAPCKLLLNTMRSASLQPDAVTFDALIGGCCQKGLWQQALLMLSRATSLSVAAASTYQQGLQACFRGSQPRLALLLLAEMDRTAEVDTAAINVAIATCGERRLWQQGLALLSEVQKRHMRPDMGTYAAAAAICADAATSAWPRALKLLEESQELGLASGEAYASAIVACGSRWELVLSAVAAMQDARVAPIEEMYSQVLDCFARTSMSNIAVDLLERPLRQELLPD